MVTSSSSGELSASAARPGHRPREHPRAGGRHPPPTRRWRWSRALAPTARSPFPVPAALQCLWPGRQLRRPLCCQGLRPPRPPPHRGHLWQYPCPWRPGLLPGPLMCRTPRPRRCTPRLAALRELLARLRQPRPCRRGVVAPRVSASGVSASGVSASGVSASGVSASGVSASGAAASRAMVLPGAAARSAVTAPCWSQATSVPRSPGPVSSSPAPPTGVAPPSMASPSARPSSGEPPSPPCSRTSRLAAAGWSSVRPARAPDHALQMLPASGPTWRARRGLGGSARPAEHLAGAGCAPGPGRRRP